MSKLLEMKLAKAAAKKGLTGKKKSPLIFGVMGKTGLKTSPQKKAAPTKTPSTKTASMQSMMVKHGNERGKLLYRMGAGKKIGKP